MQACGKRRAKDVQKERIGTGNTTSATVGQGQGKSRIYDYSGHKGADMREIQLRDAKANLSAVVDEAIDGKPAVITRHGKKQAVVLGYEEWQRLSRVLSFGRLLMAAPLRAGDLPARNLSKLRKIGRANHSHRRLTKAATEQER
jgi:prevent-host-death family protein